MRRSHQPATSIAAYLAWFAAAVLVHLLLATSSASAQSLTGTIREFGLIGTRSDNCGASPGPSNQFASFSISPRGNIMLRNDFGPNYGDMVYRIVDAQRISEFRISLRQLLTTDDQIALDTVMVKANGRLRIWSSRGADGSEYVQDGVVPAANNHETGWMERCDTRSAGTAEQRRTGPQVISSVSPRLAAAMGQQLPSLIRSKPRPALSMAR
jgi:hypothetical protein